MNMTQKDKFRGLLSAFDTAVLITHAGRDLHARPMAIADIDDDCDLWFITDEDSMKVQEIETNARVTVVCQNGWNSCISISGRATFNYDQARIRELWNPAYQAWLPKGPTDPSIVLIHVRGEIGEYWDNTGLNAITYAYQTIKAIVTGTPPEIKEGEQHGMVNLVHT